MLKIFEGKNGNTDSFGPVEFSTFPPKINFNETQILGPKTNF